MSDGPLGPGWWQASDNRWYPPQGQATPPHAPEGPPGDPVRTNGMAVTSLVLGLLSLVVCAPAGIAGLITGTVARRRIAESAGAEKGEGMALAGVITSVVGVVLWGLGLLLIAAVVFLGGSSSSKFEEVGSAFTSTTSYRSSSTTTVARAEPAAGEPCVPLAEPLPVGAPDVPITLGMPSAELVQEDLIVGDGEEIRPGATVTVDYIGVSCSTGEVFDDSYTRGEPTTFPLSGVIDGWAEGLVGMQVGGERLLMIPPDKGYGAAGSPPAIRPYETLIFVVTLHSVEQG